MANINLHVWYDRRGKIIAVGKPLGSTLESVTPVAISKGHAVVPVEVSERDIGTLHQTHIVDVKKKRIALRKGK